MSPVLLAIILTFLYFFINMMIIFHGASDGTSLNIRDGNCLFAVLILYFFGIILMIIAGAFILPSTINRNLQLQGWLKLYFSEDFLNWDDEQFKAAKQIFENSNATANKYSWIYRKSTAALWKKILQKRKEHGLKTTIEENEQ